MSKYIFDRSKIEKWFIQVFLLILLLGTVIPSTLTPFITNLDKRDRKTGNQKLSFLKGPEPNTISSFPLKLDGMTEDNPEIFFPDFLYYSIEVANTLIDHLFDNVSGGFYTSSDEQWQEIYIDTKKETYDNAQAILALLKLSKAVINLTEREFALNIAKKTGNYLITDLYDEFNEGFYTSQTDNYKKPGIQAKAIQALLSLYEATGNETYKEVAIRTFNFLDEFAWKMIKDNQGYFVYLLSHLGPIASTNPNPNDPYDPESKRVDHNVLMGNALLDLYRLESNINFLTYAQQIYDFLNTTCRDNSTGLFYTGLNSTDEIVNSNTVDIFINSQVLEFLAYLYSITKDLKYYDEFFSLLFSIMSCFWDNRYGGYYASYSVHDFGPVDKKKYAERQFYAIRALDEAYKLSNNSVFYNLILDVFEFLNDKLYDDINGGYFQLTNNDGTPGDLSWNSKYSVTQSLAIYSLANLWLYSKPSVLNAIWSPSTPRPQDSVTISAAAFDPDGISKVLINYSLNDEVFEEKEMGLHPLVGNIYNYSLPAQPHGTTIEFNIIVNDSEGNQITRGSYSFLWQIDTWGPHIQIIEVYPGAEIPVNTPFSITTLAHDVPSQGRVEHVRMYYHLSGEVEDSIALEQIDLNLWQINFSDGFSKIGSYAFYFEGIDDRGNYEYSSMSYLQILGHVETLPLPFIIGLLFFFIIVVPAGLYAYTEFKSKTARKTLKSIKKTRDVKQRKKRGTRRLS